MRNIQKERDGMVSFEINEVQAQMILEMSIPEVMQCFGCSLSQAKSNRLAASMTLLKSELTNRKAC